MTRSDLPPDLRADLELARSSIPEREPGGAIHLFTLRGRSAVVLLALALILLVANALYHRTELSEAEASAVRRSLALHYRVDLLWGSDLEGMTRDERREFTERLASYREVEIHEAAAKGWGRGRVVRVDVSVAGGPPPDGVSPRYLKLACIRSCAVEGLIGPISYALGLWFVEAEGTGWIG